MKKPLLNSRKILHKSIFILIAICCSYVVKAQNIEPYSWSNVAMGGGGFVSGIVTSKSQPGLIYCRTDVGGAYRWDSVNNKWIQLLDFANENQQGYYGVLSIAIDEKSPNIVYMEVGISYWNNGASYILRSADYGATFTSTTVTSQFKINGNANGRQNGERLQVDPVNSNILYCGSQANGLFMSTNAGNTWTRLPGLAVTTTTNGDGVNLVTLDSTSTALVNNVKQTQRMFVGVSRLGLNKNLYRSDDGGNTFTAIQPPTPIDTSLMPHKAVLSNGYLFVTYANGGGPASISAAEPCSEGQIWKYKIADGSWVNVTPVVSGSSVTVPWCGISVDPGNPNRIIASTTDRYSQQYKYNGASVYGDKIFMTTDGGASWKDLIGSGIVIGANGIPWIAGASIHWAGSVQFDPSNTNRVFIGSGDGIFANNDINNSNVWNFVAQGIEESVPKNIISIVNGPFSAVIGDYGGFTNRNPLTYDSRISPNMGSTGALDYAVTSKKVVLVNTNLYYSTDQGYTFTRATGTAKGSNGQVAISPDGSTILHCPATTSTYRSTDNGTTWTTCTGLTVNTRPVADGANSSKFYAYDSGTGKLFVSTNGGVSFSAAANTTNASGSTTIRTIPGREGSVWIALYGNGLVYTDNAGATAFTKVTAVTSCESVGIGKAYASGGYETIYISGTVNGVFGLHRSVDKGVTWTKVNDDQHQYGGPGNAGVVLGDINTYGRFYMTTAGRGVAVGTTIPAISVSQSSLTYASAAGNQIINITSNQTSAITSNQSWLTTSVTSKYNSDTLMVLVTANPSGNSRTGTITLTGGGVSATVNVTQVAASTTYYSKSTGDLSSVSTYGTGTDGSGTPPSDFNGLSPNTIYQLANRSNYALTANLTIGSTLNIPSGFTLDLAGNTLSTNTIAGSGTLIGSNTSSLVVNGTITSLAFATGKEQLGSLTLGSSANLTMASFLAIAGTGTVTLGSNATLNTNNTLTLRSDASGTAQIAALGTDASISGNVTVERYIADKRGWRLITSPVYSTQSINAAWQEGAGGTTSNPNPGYGTFMIGSSTANGFDIAGTSGSLLVYNGSSFSSTPNTNSTPISSNTGYFLFSIGNRGVNPATPGVHGPTILRSNGTVVTGTQIQNINAAGFTLVGNPYPAPVDFSQVIRSASVPNQFYTWDINLGTYGGYVLVSYNGGSYTSVPSSPSGLTNIIPSGAAIFVQSDGNNTGTLTVNENSKASAPGSGSFSNFVTSVAANNQHNLRVNLTDGTSNLIDGVMASYAPGYSNKVDNNDALKIPNFYENISLARSGKLLTLERRSDITTKDTVFIRLSGVKATGYQLQIDPADFNEPGMVINLEDAYLHTSTKLDLNQVSNISFGSNADTASFKNRFKIIFASANAINNTVSIQTPRINSGVTAYPNPTTQKQINLTFENMPTGNYNITVSNAFGQVMQRNSMVYNGTNASKILSANYIIGVYTVNIQSANYNQSIKVIVR